MSSRYAFLIFIGELRLRILRKLQSEMFSNVLHNNEIAIDIRDEYYDYDSGSGLVYTVECCIYMRVPEELARIEEKCRCAAEKILEEDNKRCCRLW